jgi:exodeoxyribonuclease III
MAVRSIHALLETPMKLASFNINNINRRLVNLLRWLREAEPNIVCLQELKAADTEFPADAIRQAGYQAVWRGERRWNGVAILARWTPVVTRTDLPGDVSDEQCRYLEAAVNGVLVASIYAPNGNPQPGPKFEYKLAWLERLTAHAAELYATGAPVVLAGDYNVVPTDLDIYPTKSWDRNALLQPASRAGISGFSRKAGPTPFALSIPTNRCTRSGITCGRAGNVMAVCVSTTF